MDALNLILKMAVFPTAESSKWEFVLRVEGFETEEQANAWMNLHRETLIDETLLRLKK